MLSCILLKLITCSLKIHMIAMLSPASSDRDETWHA